jgi:cyanophycin synthetase
MLAYADTNTNTDTDTNTDCANRDIKILEIRHLNGPNVWTFHPVLEAIVDI